MEPKLEAPLVIYHQPTRLTCPSTRLTSILSSQHDSFVVFVEMSDSLPPTNNSPCSDDIDDARRLRKNFNATLAQQYRDIACHLRLVLELQKSVHQPVDLASSANMMRSYQSRSITDCKLTTSR